MQMTITDEIQAYRPELIALRREFHKYPELGYKEFRTSKAVYDYLRAIRIDSVRNVCKTGVVGSITGRKNNGRAVMLRVTMDAVAVQEKTGLEYASLNPGYMHCGGTDAEMAVALVVSKLMQRHRDLFQGTFEVVFQPDGELGAARDMIGEGLLEDLKPDHCLTMHFTSLLNSGKVGISSGVVTGCTRQFVIHLRGNSGSSYMPHQSKDIILAASRIVDSMQFLETRVAEPFETIRVMFGKINGGTARNLTPQELSLEGTIRSLRMNGNDLNQKLEQEFRKVVESVCRQMDIEYDIEFLNSIKSVENHRETAKILKSTASRVCRDPEGAVDFRTLMSEDFSEFSMRIPSVITFFGTYNPGKNCIFPNNNPAFILDEDVMIEATEFFFRAILELLNKTDP